MEGGFTMNRNILLFILCFAVAFGGGYLFYNSGQPQEVATPAENHTSHEAAPSATENSNKTEAPAPSTTPATASSTEGQIFTQKGCVACHSVQSLNVQGGAVGPDLSQAYANVKDKHGVPIEEFLKKPTSAVMSGVLGKQPLTDEEREAILKALKLASEKK